MLTKAAIEEEIRRRANVHLPQTHLVADYYRIRRRVAFPLPIREIHLPKMPVPGIATYPWSIWMIWDLEERIHSLGWVTAWFEDEAARAAVRRDLEALASWPCYRQLERPDLALGHAGRLIWYALSNWTWLDEDLQAALHGAMTRLIDDGLPYSRDMHGAYKTVADIHALDAPHSVLHNIPFIGTVGMALCAHTTNHPARDELDDRLEALFTAILDLRAGGHSEGVGYDGYIGDFAVPWLSALDEGRRDAIVAHPRFGDLLDESIALSAPGDLARVSEIGDVEPKEMPYHLSAHAKSLVLQDNARATWLLRRCRIDWLRCDALAALRDRVDGSGEAAPETNLNDAHYAVCLRSGWEPNDLAVSMSYSNSPMGHLQLDAGTVTIGTRGHWLVGDPGYQQYMKKQERVFTLGETAHNAPVIDGRAQTKRLSARDFTVTRDGDAARLDAELTGGYEIEGVERVRRSTWQVGQELVVVCDRIEGAHKAVGYHWHGDPDAAWWVADGMARIYVPQVTLWIACPSVDLEEEQVDRIPGSRGHLTLRATVGAEAGPVFWVFAVGDTPPRIALEDGGLTVNGKTFTL